MGKVLLLLVLAACGTAATSEATTTTTDVDVSGRWVLTDYMVDGEWQTVETDREPWLELEDGELSGYPDACNRHGADYTVDRQVLQLDNVWMNIAACDQMINVEPFFSEGPVEATVDGSVMTWTKPGLGLRFSR